MKELIYVVFLISEDIDVANTLVSLKRAAESKFDKQIPSDL